VVIWNGPFARAAGNLVSGLFPFRPSQPFDTYVVFGCGSVLYRPVVFGCRL
jgi:hypothetical protein